jgi:cell division transport system permease protein
MPLEFLMFWTRETVSNIVRNRLMSLLAMSTVAIGLFILGGFYLSLAHVRTLVDEQMQKLDITVFLDPNITPKRRREIYEASRIPQVADLKFSSKSQELKKLHQEVPGISIDDMGRDNPLSDALYIKVKDPQTIPAVRAYFKTLIGKGVKDIESADEIVGKLLQFNRILTLLGGVSLFVLVLAILAIIYNTIRLTIHARRREIRIMELVGATRGFIRVPFVLEGIVLGSCGAALSAILLASVYTAVARALPAWLPPLEAEPMRQCALGMIAAGFLFGLAGSLISLERSITKAAMQA